MGCKLIRGDTVYFVRHAGRTTGTIEREWICDGIDGDLLPPVYTRSDGHVPPRAMALAIPVEIRTFEGS